MGKYSIPDSDVKRYTDYLDKIKSLFQDDDCLQYYVVKNDELLELKKEIDERHKDIMEEEIYTLYIFKHISEYLCIVNEQFTITINNNPLTLLGAGYLHVRDTSIISGQKIDTSVLHREFSIWDVSRKYNMLYYHKIENCDLDISGTGIGFIDKNGNKQYFILPAFEGLMIIMRDKCMIHNTPNIEPIDPKKPITRILMRDYIGSPLEVSYFDQEKYIDEFEELIKKGIVKVNTIHTEFPGGNYSNIHFYHCY
jgi:hypothetical protein